MEEFIRIPNQEKKINIVLLMLLDESEHSHLPEFYQIFGKELLLDFLDIFGGSTVKVPSRRSLIKSVESVEIYTELEKDSSPQRVSELSEKFDISEETVKRRAARIKTLISQQNKILTKLIEPYGERKRRKRK